MVRQHTDEQATEPIPGDNIDAADRIQETLDQLTHELGGSDLFVLRRITGTRFVHVGGVGRGIGWAGAIEIDVGTDPLGSQLRIGTPLWSQQSEPHQIFGPYDACAAAAVRLDQDVIVVLGSDNADTFEPAAADVISCARNAANLVDAVAPAKLLADELEILHALRALSDCRGHSVAEVLDDIARVAADALSCEFAIAWMPDGRFDLHETGWKLPDGGQQIDTIMAGLWERNDLPRHVQVALDAPLGYPLDPASGIVSYYALAIGEPPVSLLLVAHTNVNPRGFTELCLDLGAQLAATAATLLANAVLREQLMRVAADETAAHRDLAKVNTELADAALHDSLTGLPNRVLLQRHADRLAHREMSSGVSGSEERPMVLYIDLDNFKSVNDEYGHAVGDGVLVEFAHRLVTSCRPNDIAARLAGDEFVVLLVDPLSEADAMAVANRVVHEASLPYLLADKVATIGASVGIAAFTTGSLGGTDVPPLDVLLHRADLAMYRAKKRGRGRAEVFTSRTTASIGDQNRRWADDPAAGRRLRASLDDGALTIRYQPMIDLLTGSVLETEALVYWPQPPLPAIAPDELIPLAERTGLTEPLGEWTLREACRNIAWWNRRSGTGVKGPVVGVNINADQLSDPDFPQLVVDILSEAGVEADRLCLEVAESGMTTDRQAVATALGTLRDSGVKLAVDGFGTGLSSLTLIRHVPLDWVKIDQELVSRVDVEPADAGLVRLVIESAHSVGVRVCALGVDRHAQLEQLTTMACDAVQGNLLGGPVEPELLDSRDRAVRALIAPGAGRPLTIGRGHLRTLIDAEGKFTYLSAEAISLLGYQPSELLGKRALDLVPSDYQSRAREPFHQNDVADQVLVHPLLRKDGSMVWVEVTHQFTRDTGGRGLRHLSATAMDVTARVHVERELAARERRLHSAFDSAPQGIAVLDAQGVLTQFNPALERMLGHNETELLGHALREFIHPDDQHEFAQLIADTATVGESEYAASIRFLQETDSALCTDVTLRVIYDEEHPTYLVLHIHPVETSPV